MRYKCKFNIPVIPTPSDHIKLPRQLIRNEKSRLQEILNKALLKIKTNYLFFPACLIMYFILGLYTDKILIKLFLLLPSTWPAYNCLRHLYLARQEKINRILLGHFLQLILSELTTGNSFEQSFRKASFNLISISGDKNKFIQSLITSSNAMRSHIPAPTALKNLAAVNKDNLAGIIFELFYLQLKTNGNMQNLCQFTTTLTHELNETENEIITANNRQTVEAFILAIIPFALTFFMKVSADSYFKDAANSTLGQVLKLVAFTLAIIASSLTFYITGSGFAQVGRANKFNIEPLLKVYNRYAFMEKIGLQVRSIIPYELLLKLQTSLNQAGMNQPLILAGESSLNRNLLSYLSFLPIFSIISILFSALILYRIDLSIWFAPLIIPFTSLIILYLPLKLAKDCQTDLVISFPMFAGLVNALLNSGFVPQKAIDLAITLLGKNDTVLGEELKAVKTKLKMGMNIDYCLNTLAPTIQVPEIQASLNLINQFARNGNKQALTLLSIQADTCWQLAKSTLQKQRENTSLVILLPMMLNLLSIILIALTPVIASFGSYL